MTKKRHSAARKLLQLVYDHNREATGWSWERLNHSMQDALYLAMDSGMRFALDDFEEMHSDFKGGHWFGTDNAHSQGERFYRRAVETGNISACQSFERWKSRSPFIFQGNRLFIGSIIEWQGETVAVTSFADDGSYLTACVYTERPYQHDGRTYYHGKVKRRFKIALTSLRAAEREREKSQKEQKAKQHAARNGSL